MKKFEIGEIAYLKIGDDFIPCITNEDGSVSTVNILGEIVDLPNDFPYEEDSFVGEFGPEVEPEAPLFERILISFFKFCGMELKV